MVKRSFIGTLYYRTKYFWVLSRIVLIVFLLDSYVNQNAGINSDIQSTVGLVFLGYLLIVFYLLLADIINKVPSVRALKIVNGILTIFLSVILGFMMVVVGYDILGVQSYYLYVIPIWLILLGLYDFISLNPVEK